MSNQIAQTILSQLGGTKFQVMVGAKQMNSTSNALHFKFGSGAKNKANHCSITLQTDDTYMMEFHRVVSVNAKHIGVFHNIYASGLTTVFTRETGMHTSL